MGLISSFEKDKKTTPTRTPQPGGWNILPRKEGACLFLMAYKSGDDARQGPPPQMLVFEPRHIKKFDDILNEWKKAAKYKPPEESGDSGLVKPQAARVVKESGGDSSAMRQIAEALGLATKEDIAQLKERLDILAKQGGR